MLGSGWTKNTYGRRFNSGPSEFLIEVKRRLETGVQVKMKGDLRTRCLRELPQREGARNR